MSLLCKEIHVQTFHQSVNNCPVDESSVRNASAYLALALKNRPRTRVAVMWNPDGFSA
jgi:hypothetical protein